MALPSYFIRHGQTDYNREQRFQGQEDTELNATGRVQARRNGEKLRELVADADAFDFVASPMTRTRQTMEIIREAMGLPAEDYRTDKRLVEVHFGDWHGHTYRELEASDPHVYARRRRAKWTFVPPGDGAESYQMLLERVRPWFQALRQPTVCVTHGGVLRTIFRLTEALPESEAADMDMPQDRILRLDNGKLDWL